MVSLYLSSSAQNIIWSIIVFLAFFTPLSTSIRVGGSYLQMDPELITITFGHVLLPSSSAASWELLNPLT